MNLKKKDRSVWLMALVGLMSVEAILSLMQFSILGFALKTIIAIKLWDKSATWRSVTAFIYVPLGLLCGVLLLNELDYTGEFVIIEVFILVILLCKTWKEIDENKSDEDKELDEEIIEYEKNNG